MCIRDRSKTIMKESAKKEVVVDKKTVIKGRPIQGGYVLWQEDIKDILMLLEKMEENRKTIEESNCCLLYTSRCV